MRIVCLSAEAADICARLGVWHSVVGVSAFASQVDLAPKPVISGFSKADAAKIASLAPDLVITFSDVQADIAAQLVREGLVVLATNQRSLAEIERTIGMIAGAIGLPVEGAALASQFTREIAELRCADVPRPRIYFEEWPDPIISGIGWVGELVELTGGIDVFAERRATAAADRRVSVEEVVAANPDIILASWCGRPVDLASIRGRPGFDKTAAVRCGQLHALDSSDFLQPGPRLLSGARTLLRLFGEWRKTARETKKTTDGR